MDGGVLYGTARDYLAFTQMIMNGGGHQGRRYYGARPSI